MSQYTINHSSNCLNTADSYYTNVSNNYTVADYRLSPLEPRSRYRNVQERCFASIGEWLIKNSEFRRLSGSDGEGEGDSAVPFCYGDPGVGKTFIR